MLRKTYKFITRCKNCGAINKKTTAPLGVPFEDFSGENASGYYKADKFTRSLCDNCLLPLLVRYFI